jgi:hypothetical protein
MPVAYPLVAIAAAAILAPRRRRVL